MCYMSQDFREGMEAFLGKRPPQLDRPLSAALSPVLTDIDPGGARQRGHAAGAMRTALLALPAAGTTASNALSETSQ